MAKIRTYKIILYKRYFNSKLQILLKKSAEVVENTFANVTVSETAVMINAPATITATLC